MHRTLLVLLLLLLWLGRVPVSAQITNTAQLNVTPTTASLSGSGTLTVAETSFIAVTCSAGGGCAATLSETSARNGQELTVCNSSSSSGSVTFADSSGVQETVGGTTVTLAASECVLWKYATTDARWKQVGGSGGGGSGASVGASYLQLGTDATNTSERVFTPGTSLSATDGGAGSTYSLNTIQDIRTTATPTFDGIIASLNRTTSVATGYAGQFRVTAGAGGTITQGVGIQITDPAETGGGVISAYDGLRILDSNVTGVTWSDNRAIAVVHPSSGYTHLYANGKFGSLTNWSADPAGNIFSLLPVYTGGVLASSTNAQYVNYDVTATGTQTKDFGGTQGSVTLHGSGVYRSVQGGYFYVGVNDTPTFSAWSPVDGGGAFGLIGDFAHYGTSTVALGVSMLAWGGTGTGSTTTNLYRFYVPQLYEYSGAITTHVGLQIDDQSTGASGITNNWLIRAQAPSSKDFRVRADGALTLGGVQYTFPASDSSGCLASNGSGTLAWGSCSGTSGYTTVADEGSNLTARATVNFTGAGVSCVDNGGATRTDCTITGTGGSGSITASGYTMTTSRLLGRTTASTGAVEEMTVGNGLALASGNLATACQVGEFDAGNSSTSIALDWTNGNQQIVTLTGNLATLTLSNPVAGCTYRLLFVQGAGPYTVTWPSSVKFENDTPPTFTTTNAKVIFCSLVRTTLGADGYLGWCSTNPISQP